VVDRIGDVRVARSEQMGPDTGPEVPDQRWGVWAQDAADLGQAGRVGPVVHGQGADDQVERLVGEGQGGHVTDQERWSAPATISWSVGVGSGAGDHGRVQVEAGHLEPMMGQPGRQVAGPAPDLQHPGAVGRDRGDIGRDACEKRAEQEPAEGLVADGIANEDAAWHLLPSGGVAAATQDHEGGAGRAGHDDELPRLDHHTSTGDPRRC
jgi:hypothetical protein